MGREGVGEEEGFYRSVLGETCASTPMALPIRGHLDGIKRILEGDCNIGCGSRQRGLGKSLYCNDYKVAVYGRSEAMRQFESKAQYGPEPARTPVDSVGFETCLPLGLLRLATTMSSSEHSWRSIQTPTTVTTRTSQPQHHRY